jgi:hypothetical protein
MTGSLEFWSRVKYSFYATLVFLILTNPITYSTTAKLLKTTTSVYLVHGLVFFLLIFALMLIPGL